MQNGKSQQRNLIDSKKICHRKSGLNKEKTTMTRIDVHEAISRLDIIPKFKIYTFCLLSGIKLEELEEILAEVFDRRIGAMMAISELMKEDVVQEIARKKGEVR